MFFVFEELIDLNLFAYTGCHCWPPLNGQTLKTSHLFMHVAVCPNKRSWWRPKTELKEIEYWPKTQLQMNDKVIIMSVRWPNVQQLLQVKINPLHTQGAENIFYVLTVALSSVNWLVLLNVFPKDRMNVETNHNMLSAKVKTRSTRGIWHRGPHTPPLVYLPCFTQYLCADVIWSHETLNNWAKIV